MSFEQHNCDRLWKIWYAICIGLVHTFLTYNIIRQYLEFKNQSRDPLYGGHWSLVPMNFCIAMLVSSLAILPLFIYSALFKVGNFANDGIVIGKDPDNLQEAVAETSKQAHESLIWKRIRRHFLPFSSLLHVVSAFCLLLPKSVLQAEQIRNEALDKHFLISSDLDFIFRPDQQKRLKKYFAGSGTIAQSNLFLSPEMCNFILALAILTIRYPTSFWYANKSFSLIFSFFLFMTGVYLVFDYCAFTVLFKTASNTGMTGFTFPAPVGPWGCLVCEVIGFLVLLACQVLIYEYGHSQFLYSLRKHGLYLNSQSEISQSDTASSVDEYGCRIRTCRQKNAIDGCCFRFWPNIVSLVLLVILVAVRGFLIWFYIYLYSHLQDSLTMTTVIVTIAFLVTWLLVWFCFSIKTSWRFQVNAKSMQMITKDGLKRPDSVYGCYHGEPLLAAADLSRFPPGSLSNQGNIPTDCCSESSKASSSVRGGNNYVYLQHSLPTIPTISEHMDGSAASDISYENPSSRLLMQTSVDSSQISQTASYLQQQRRLNSKDPNYATLAQIMQQQNEQGLQNHQADEMDADNNMTGSLTRNSRTRRSGNRVTFKDNHDTIPGSPSISQQSSTMPSSDSGIGGLQVAGQQSLHNYVTNQQHRAKTGDGNYEDYPMFGNLFNPYNRKNSMDNDTNEFMKVPDILMNDQNGQPGIESERSGNSSVVPGGNSLQRRVPQMGRHFPHMNTNINGSTDTLRSNSNFPMPPPPGLDNDQSLCSQV